MSKFAYERSKWQHRVQVAQDAKNDLANLGQALDNLVGHNYFGIGCEEGTEVYTRLRDLVSAGVQRLSEYSTEASTLEATARSAESTLATADAESANQIRTPPR
ncbi:hypothetical protein WKY82_11520 [Gordonia malaquae]|uniref:hypothetical protein n=1 Tax=Gordonia TaxID=2053 RepID=UPI0030C79CA0